MQYSNTMLGLGMIGANSDQLCQISHSIQDIPYVSHLVPSFWGPGFQVSTFLGVRHTYSHFLGSAITRFARSGEPCQVMGRFVLKRNFKGTLHPMPLLHRLGWVCLVMTWRNKAGWVRQDQFWNFFFQKWKKSATLGWEISRVVCRTAMNHFFNPKSGCTRLVTQKFFWRKNKVYSLQPGKHVMAINGRYQPRIVYIFSHEIILCSATNCIFNHEWLIQPWQECHSKPSPLPSPFGQSFICRPWGALACQPVGYWWLWWRRRMGRKGKARRMIK